MENRTLLQLDLICEQYSFNYVPHHHGAHETDVAVLNLPNVAVARGRDPTG